MAYARSSANLLSKLILHDQIDSYRWEVSNNPFMFYYVDDDDHSQFFVFSFPYFLRIEINFYWNILQCLFRTPLNNYDAVVLIHRDRLPYPHHLLFPSDLNQGNVLAGYHWNTPCPMVSSCLVVLIWHPFKSSHIGGTISCKAKQVPMQPSRYHVVPTRIGPYCWSK